MFLAKVENILLFLTTLFLPTQLGRHFWPSFSYIYSLKIDYLSPTLYFWDLLVLGLLAVWIFRKPRINKLALNLLLFYLFTQALSLLSAQNLGAGLLRIEQYTLAGFFGVYLASVISLEKKIATPLIFLPLALGILGESLIAIIQFLKGSTIGLWVLGERTFTVSTPGIAKFDFYGYQFLRPYATFPHPNVLAGYLLVGIILLSFWGALRLRSVRLQNSGREDFGQVCSPQSGPRMTLLLVSILGGLTIFLTMSRAAILAGIVAAALVLRRKSIMIIMAITIILFPILFTRFSSVFNFDNLTYIRREELMVQAWQLFLKNPFFGVGLNNFIPAMSGDLLIGPSRFLQPVHNIFFLTLAETGVVGLFGFLLLVGYPIIKIFNFQFSIFKIIPWFIIIFLGVFDHYFLTLPQGYRLLFLVWGLSFSVLK